MTGHLPPEQRQELDRIAWMRDRAAEDGDWETYLDLCHIYEKALELFPWEETA
jgi:hypothetical protein